MEQDLTDLLNDWPFEPGKINVRLIQGRDGEPRIQVRLDLGILQMFVDGRPDGQKPFGYGSLLEYHEARLDEAGFEAELSAEDEAPGQPADSSFNEPEPATPEAEGVAPSERTDEDSEDGSAPPPKLSPEECRALREEALQYYHRYIALLVLEDYDGVVRDTTRNLRVLDLCARHAATEADRSAMEQFRPYITMMRARAMASQSIQDSEPKAAIHAIDEGIESLRAYFERVGHPEAFEESSEVQLLRGMRDALVPKLPVSQKAELRQRLQEALASENYELAAILRDELRLLPD